MVACQFNVQRSTIDGTDMTLAFLNAVVVAVEEAAVELTLLIRGLFREASLVKLTP